eukprot:jgi/Botrbrau1/13032/Bobra.0389s0023.1
MISYPSGLGRGSPINCLVSTPFSRTQASELERRSFMRQAFSRLRVIGRGRRSTKQEVTAGFRNAAEDYAWDRPHHAHSYSSQGEIHYTPPPETKAKMDSRRRQAEELRKKGNRVPTIWGNQERATDGQKVERKNGKEQQTPLAGQTSTHNRAAKGGAPAHALPRTGSSPNRTLTHTSVAAPKIFNVVNTGTGKPRGATLASNNGNAVASNPLNGPVGRGGRNHVQALPGIEKDLESLGLDNRVLVNTGAVPSSAAPSQEMMMADILYPSLSRDGQNGAHIQRMSPESNGFGMHLNGHASVPVEIMHEHDPLNLVVVAQALPGPDIFANGDLGLNGAKSGDGPPGHALPPQGTGKPPKGEPFGVQSTASPGEGSRSAANGTPPHHQVNGSRVALVEEGPSFNRRVPSKNGANGSEGVSGAVEGPDASAGLDAPLQGALSPLKEPLAGPAQAPDHLAPLREGGSTSTHGTHGDKPGGYALSVDALSRDEGAQRGTEGSGGSNRTASLSGPSASKAVQQIDAKGQGSILGDAGGVPAATEAASQETDMTFDWAGVGTQSRPLPSKGASEAPNLSEGASGMPGPGGVSGTVQHPAGSDVAPLQPQDDTLSFSETAVHAAGAPPGVDNRPLGGAAAEVLSEWSHGSHVAERDILASELAHPGHPEAVTGAADDAVATSPDVFAEEGEWVRAHPLTVDEEYHSLSSGAWEAGSPSTGLGGSSSAGLRAPPPGNAVRGGPAVHMQSSVDISAMLFYPSIILRALTERRDLRHERRDASLEVLQREVPHMYGPAEPQKPAWRRRVGVDPEVLPGVPVGSGAGVGPFLPRGHALTEAALVAAPAPELVPGDGVPGGPKLKWQLHIPAAAEQVSALAEDAEMLQDPVREAEAEVLQEVPADELTGAAGVSEEGAETLLEENAPEAQELDWEVPSVEPPPNVWAVESREDAERVVQQLCGPLRDRIFACDTEVTGLDISKESPCGHGRVICFSLYCGEDVHFGPEPAGEAPRHMLFVDTMLCPSRKEEASAILEAFSPLL